MHIQTAQPELRRQGVQQWKELATAIAEVDGKSVASLYPHVDALIKSNDLANSLVELCPQIALIISHVCIVRIGFRAEAVQGSLVEWGDSEARKVGRSMSTFVRYSTTPQMAVDAWRRNYPQLDVLFTGVVGFEEFMVIIATHILKNHKVGLYGRVIVGAILSTLDGATDIFMITTYYSSGLRGRATALVTMVGLSMIYQLVIAWSQYQKHSRLVKLKEILITLFFLRPAVDAYRVSTNHVDDKCYMDPLTEVSVAVEIYVLCQR